MPEGLGNESVLRYLTIPLDLSDVEGPLRFYRIKVTPDRERLIVCHADGKLELEVPVRSFHDRLAAAQAVFKRRSLPLEILRDMLPNLCEACGLPLLGASVCEACWARMLDDFVGMTGE